MDKQVPAKCKVLVAMLEEYHKDVGNFNTVTPERCGISQEAFDWSLRMLKANQLITGPEWADGRAAMDRVMLTRDGVEAATFFRDAEVMAQ